MASERSRYYSRNLYSLFLYFPIVAALFPLSESFPFSRVLRSVRVFGRMSDAQEGHSRVSKQFDATLRSSSLGEESDSDYFHESEQYIEQTSSSQQPKFSVGVIADIQYAPIPDGFSYSGQPRYYRHSLDVAKHAFEHFEEEEVHLVLNLGDIVDGKCQDIVGNGGDPIPDSADPGLYSLEHVLDALSTYKSGRTIHTYGNHCLYNLGRPTLAEKVGIPFVEEPCGDLVGYSSHVYQGVRFVVVDSYDIALMRRCEKTSQKYKEATAVLKEKNPNFPDNFNSPEGLEGLEKRFVGFGGGVGTVQLGWLKKTLEEARVAKEKVVVLSHQPIAPSSSNPVCLIWNFDEVMEILREFSDVVVASFSGHAHKGGYIRDPESGIHFRVFEAALENRPERTYAIVDFHENHLVVRGFGNCQSAVYDFSHTLDKNFVEA